MDEPLFDDDEPLRTEPAPKERLYQPYPGAVPVPFSERPQYALAGGSLAAGILAFLLRGVAEATPTLALSICSLTLAIISLRRQPRVQRARMMAVGGIVLAALTPALLIYSALENAGILPSIWRLIVTVLSF